MKVMMTVMLCLGAACRQVTPVESQVTQPTAVTLTATVKAAEEQDISKAQGHPKLHTYLTLEVPPDAAPEVLSAARHGELKVNIRSDHLVRLHAAPIKVGQRLRCSGTVSTMQPGYLQLTSVEPAPP